MNWTRLLAVIRKEFIQLRRDPTTLALLVGIPVVELLMFGYALNTVVDHLPTAIYDQSETSASRQFVAAFQNSGYFDNRLWVSSEDELRRAIDDGTVKVGLVIPPDFGDAALRKELATAQIVIDGSDPNVAQTALFAGGLIGQVQSANIVTELLNRAGSKATNGAIDLRPVVLYNPRMLSVTFMVPGLIGFVMQFQAVLLTAFAVVRERERGTLEQLLVSPVKRAELVVGKVLPNALLASVSVVLALLVAWILFGVKTAGSLPLLALLTAPFLLCSLGVGLFISVTAKSQHQAQQMAMFILLPGMLLSGFLFPREGMPAIFQYISLAIPLTYYLQILRGVMLKGVGIGVLWPQFLALCSFAGVIMLTSIWQFRKTLE